MKALMLLETLLENQTNKLTYIRTVFQEFNTYQKRIMKDIKDIELTKYLIEINHKEFKNRVNLSQLSDDKEKSYTFNVLKAYKRKALKELK